MRNERDRELTTEERRLAMARLPWKERVEWVAAAIDAAELPTDLVARHEDLVGITDEADLSILGAAMVSLGWKRLSRKGGGYVPPGACPVALAARRHSWAPGRRVFDHGEARRLVAAGVPKKEVARRLGVTAKTIRDVTKQVEA